MSARSGDCVRIPVDARGHGDSRNPHGLAPRTIEWRAVDIVSVLNDLWISRTHYFGSFTGGWIGFGLAKHAPDRLGSLAIARARAAKNGTGQSLLSPEISSRRKAGE
jgi:pimeloyl-ACP methyl ester carboxylesterase